MGELSVVAAGRMEGKTFEYQSSDTLRREFLAASYM